LTIGITGFRSSITARFLELIPDLEEVRHGAAEYLPTDCDRYFLCAGFLAGRSAEEITPEDSDETWRVNFQEPVRLCDRILESNAYARICIMGSESGFAGSFDTAYAGAKAALHTYVETKRLTHPSQQIVAIAPTIIEDTRMTYRRRDFEETIERGARRRLQRWLSAIEVARMAHFLLYVDRGYTTNTVIRMTGGTW